MQVAFSEGRGGLCPAVHDPQLEHLLYEVRGVQASISIQWWRSQVRISQIAFLFDSGEITFTHLVLVTLQAYLTVLVWSSGYLHWMSFL
jgi:hypothetical protein